MNNHNLKISESRLKLISQIGIRNSSSKWLGVGKGNSDDKKNWNRIIIMEETLALCHNPVNHAKGVSRLTLPFKWLA